MADNVVVTAGTGTTVAADEVIDGTLGTVKVGFGKIMDGTLDSTNKLIVNSSGEALVKDTAGEASLAAINTVAGAKTDAKSTATDATSVSMMQVLKQISASVQAPASTAVTNAGTFAVQATEADGANVVLGAKADAKSTATDTTAITIMQVLKQISASVQAPPSQAVTNAGTFAVQAAVSNLPTTVDTNSGNKSASTLRVVLATDQPSLTNPTPVSQNGTWTVQPGNTANSTPWLVKEQAVSVSTQTALTTTATVSGAAGTFHGGSFVNLNSVPSYIQVFDTTGAVTLGTTVPTFVQPIPANSTAANGAAFVFEITNGITIANGIKVAATTTATGASTSATALTGYVLYR